jgi:hypothetical protein
MLAAAGMLVTTLGLVGMTTQQAHSPYIESSVWLALVGIGSGMFNSPNTAAMMGTVHPDRRGIASGARTVLQNTGAILSIALVMALITASIPTDVLLAIFSGLTTGLTEARLAPFIGNMHHTLWVLAAISMVGVVVSLLRPGSATKPQQRATAAADTIEEAILDEVQAVP